ncbi:processed acidic surface protein [Bacillus sp. Marseille-P3661]|uniref:processed acidic surface protein n=1 Tax=Bacillus sp. Marseille-P3661 TaxID=1936234 RepID=UPI000C826E72|nr:processed acidic surface protein [Bacillus sp. Marseille-P3661]
MKFLKFGLILLLALYLSNVSIATAAPPEQELNQYLAEIGWTKQELLEYLDFYEIPLEEFESVEDLKWILGTPITAQNLQDMLNRYNMTESELKELLDHFGDSLAEYKFIEDLEAAVDFYVNHDEYMAEIENELAEMGLTEEETERFFEYLTQVEENNKNQLDQMEMLDYRLEQFSDISNTADLSDEELDELVQILTESEELYEIQVKYSTDNKEITLKELLKMEKLPKNLFISIYSKSGELLIDFTLPKWMYELEEMILEGEEMIHLGELSDEYVDYLHEEKEEDAKRELK